MTLKEDLMLLEKLTTIYTKVVEAIAWIIIMLGILLGYTVGQIMGGELTTVFFYCLLGGSIGFIIEAIILPPVMILFEINEELKKIRESK